MLYSAATSMSCGQLERFLIQKRIIKNKRGAPADRGRTELAVQKIFDLVSERDMGGAVHSKQLLYQNYNKLAEMLEK